MRQCKKAEIVKNSGNSEKKRVVKKIVKKCRLWIKYRNSGKKVDIVKKRYTGKKIESGKNIDIVKGNRDSGKYDIQWKKKIVKKRKKVQKNIQSGK